MLMTSVQVKENFLIVQSSGNALSGFDITKVKFNGEKNQNIVSEIFRVNNTWLSKNNFHSSVKLCSSKTGWSARNPYLSVIK